VKYVDNHLQKVEHHPLAGGKSIDCDRSERVVFSQPGFDLVCNRFELRLRRTGADDEKIRERGNAAQIQDDNVLGLLVRGEFGAGLC
jgi:hypothetical protein